MATSAEVLEMLIPQGGWIIVGDNYEGIEWLECEPITETEFNAGFAKYDAWKAKQDADKETAKEAAQSKLTALGLTTEDLKALGL